MAVFPSVLMLAALLAPAAWAADEEALPSALTLEQVTRLAREHRSEIEAAKARARAGAARPGLVSGLEDPEVFASLDHLPFKLDGANASLSFQQRFPLSRVRGHRADAAQAEASRLSADAERVELDVELDAANAYFMLLERRGLSKVYEQQQQLAGQMVASATARYTAGTGTQADVLRAESERARLQAAARAAAAEVRGAEAMLLVSVGRTPPGEVPPLEVSARTEPPPEVGAAVEQSVAARPELKAGRAEIVRAEADGQAMRSMYAPMAMVRTGPAYTMTEGAGWMVMVGVSIPLWSSKLSAGVDEADAMTQMAKADLVSMRRMVEGDAAKAREQVVASRERYLALRDDVVPRSQRALEPTMAAYVSGQLPLVSVIEAAQALWMAQADLVMAEAELGLAWARLDRALGKTVHHDGQP